jgi:2-methylisocitrate lyase-like PEP mutase family enzyme
MTNLAARRAEFRALHERGCFVIANPWDRGTVRVLEQLGFPALATTSAGFGFARGVVDRPDALTVDDVLAHVADIVAVASVPVNVDFQNGYAADAGGVAENVTRCVQTGVAGLSIEDATGDADRPLYELGEAVERIRAAREAIDASGEDVLLTGRAECFLVGHPDPLPESIRRLQAYAEAGADVLYAPRVTSRSEIAAILEAVAPKPVNVLAADPAMRVSDLAELGVRRVSVGGTLARVAWGAFLRSAREIADAGTFTSFADAAPFPELEAFFSAPEQA